MKRLKKTSSPKSATRQALPRHDIVGKLWHLCNILRDGGITYPEYVTELTYLLFLRMAEETGTESKLPKGYRWKDLVSKPAATQFKFYKELLRNLGTKTKGRVREIFTNAETCLTNPKYLALLVTEFNQINWYEAREETALADVYEGLLEKNSSESKAGAGQYFTPRPLIECIVELTQPKTGEVIQDPACGTAGFLIAAHKYIQRSPGYAKLSKRQHEFQENKAFIGVELVAKTHRLALMNAMLHGIHSPIILGDTLGPVGARLSPADLILTNPPFGTKKGGGAPQRSDLIWRTSNKQLCFLQHIYQCLQPGGRAAVVIPDLQGPAAPEICADLMEKCHLHTILRLPTGIFYAAGVKTNVLFFTRGRRESGNTKDVWVYDLRSNMPSFGKRSPFSQSELEEFKRAFGKDPYGTSTRTATERYRRFTRQEIRERGDNLDLGWTHDSGSNRLETRPPIEIISNVLSSFREAIKEIEALKRDLEK